MSVIPWWICLRYGTYTFLCVNISKRATCHQIGHEQTLCAASKIELWFFSISILNPIFKIASSKNCISISCFPVFPFSRFCLAHLTGICCLSFGQSLECHYVGFCARIPREHPLVLVSGLASAKLWELM